jgi:hypothetical protein
VMDWVVCLCGEVSHDSKRGREGWDLQERCDVFAPFVAFSCDLCIRRLDVCCERKKKRMYERDISRDVRSVGGLI